MLAKVCYNALAMEHLKRCSVFFMLCLHSHKFYYMCSVLHHLLPDGFCDSASNSELAAAVERAARLVCLLQAAQCAAVPPGRQEELQHFSSVVFTLATGNCFTEGICAKATLMAAFVEGSCQR